jgi:tripartite-type tricarboxylate transporter receptor subunit TctC
MNIRARYVLVSLLCLLLAVLNGAHAQAAYPDRPIRFIVPYPAGGGADQITRLLAGATEGALGQPFVVDNRSGAGGGVGTDAVAKARPDGYTIGLAAIAPMSILPFAQSNLAYDPLRDLAPVTLINTNPFLVVVHPSVPANNVAELIPTSRRSPANSITPRWVTAAWGIWRENCSRAWRRWTWRMSRSGAAHRPSSTCWPAEPR